MTDVVEREKRTREYLQRGWNAERRVRAREDQIDALRDRIQRVRSAAPRGLAGDRRGPRADWTQAIDALTDAEADYLQEIAELYRLQGEIRRAITGVQPELYRELLQYRYVHCLGWEAVADKLGYEKRYVFKLHDRALKALEEEGDVP